MFTEPIKCIPTAALFAAVITIVASSNSFASDLIYCLTPDGSVRVISTLYTSNCRDAGIRSVVVTFGYTHMAPGELGADALIDRFRGLPGGRRSISTSLVSP